MLATSYLNHPLRHRSKARKNKDILLIYIYTPNTNPNRNPPPPHPLCPDQSIVKKEADSTVLLAILTLLKLVVSYRDLFKLYPL
jgi:hypothetical protein